MNVKRLVKSNHVLINYFFLVMILIIVCKSFLYLSLITKNNKLKLELIKYHMMINQQTTKKQTLQEEYNELMTTKQNSYEEYLKWVERNETIKSHLH